MSQHDFEIANQGFPSFRSDLNSGLQALASNSAGATAPSTTYAYQMWYDSTTNLLKMRNADDDAWITLAYFDQTNDEWEVRSAVIQAVDSAGVVIKTDDGTTRLTIADDGSITTQGDLTVSALLTVNDAASITNNNGVVTTFNRETSDGAIALFQKDGSTVGIIGSADSGDRIYLANGGLEGVGIDNGWNAFLPTSQVGAEKDNHLSLGRATSRFTDLYLSGGVYLGGTGAANYLDDYEEGSGTPTVTMTGSGSVTISGGNYEYTKVGNVCHFSFEFQVTGSSSPVGMLQVALPFATPSQVYTAGSLRVYNNSFTGSPFIDVESSGSQARFATNISSSATGQITPDSGGSHYFFGQVTYRTA